MRVSLLLLVLIILIFNCNKSSQKLPQTSKRVKSLTKKSLIKVSFSPFFNRKDAFTNDSKKTATVVLRNNHEQQTLSTSFKGPGLPDLFEYFEDSMLIGLIYGERISVSTQLKIDSLLETSNEIRVYSHLSYPTGLLSFSSYPCCFVVVNKTTKKILFEDIEILHEKETGTPVTFRNFLKETSMIRTTYHTKPELIKLESRADEIAFLDSCEIAPAFTFPKFDYKDSIIVGVKLPAKYSSSLRFEIVSIIKQKNKIVVNAHLWLPYYSTPDIVAPGHYVALKKLPGEMELKLQNLN